jgi:hypothetical protein
MALTGIIGQARIDCADTDEVDPAVEDDIYTSIINEYYLLWHQKVERRTTEVSPTDSGLTFTAGLTVVTTTPTDWIEIVEAYVVSAAGDVFGTPMEIVEPATILRLQQSDATPGTPTRVAFTRIASSTTSDIGKWRAFVHPIPDATTYVGLLVRAWPTLLSSPTDTPDVTELEAYTIARLAAAKVAGIFGEDQEFIGNILRDVPDQILSQIGVPRPGLKAPQYEERAA